MRGHLEALRNEVVNIHSWPELDDDLAVDLGEVEVGVGLHDLQLAFIVNLMLGPDGHQALDLFLQARVEEVVVELENITFLFFPSVRS